jgi:hypothetical protein
VLGKRYALIMRWRALGMASPLMRYAYGIHAIFQTNPFVQPNFLLQLKKVGKKSCSRAKASASPTQSFNGFAII